MKKMRKDSADFNIQGKGKVSHTYDAIVIGSGISGGWAAKEMCEKGLKTLLLERGKDVVHLKDYPTATKAPWEFAHHLKMPYSDKKDNPVVSRCYAYNESTEHFFVKDNDHPYVQEKPSRAGPSKSYLLQRCVCLAQSNDFPPT